MTVLRHVERDGTLLASASQRLAPPPDAEQVKEEVQRHLFDGQVEISSVTWTYARWKPGTSLMTVHEVEFGDGTREQLVRKSFADGKAASLAERREWFDSAPCAPGRRRRWLDTERGIAAWFYPFDRELPGLGKLIDPRWLARFVEEGEVVPRRTVRRRRTAFQLLRYKPEHRAVGRLDLVLRDQPRDAERRSFALRAIRSPAAGRVAATRERLHSDTGAPVPRLLLHDVDQGLLLEEWLEATPLDREDFDSPGEAGATLASLHRAEPPLGVAPARLSTTASALELLGPLLPGELTGLTPVVRRAVAECWVHGDFHPDQLARTPHGGTVLLDLDNTGRGDPVVDLASWSADAAISLGESAATQATAQFLEGYEQAGGRPVDPTALSAAVAGSLVRLAAGYFRRLERGAREKASRALALARVYSGSGELGP